jgi:hypothetical protein
MTTNKATNPRKEYSVLMPYQCSKTRRWLAKGDTVELLPCEAEFLKHSGKIKLAAPVATNQPLKK